MQKNYLFRVMAIVMIFLFSGKLVVGQTNPATAILPVSFTSQTGATLPTFMAIHRFGTATPSSINPTSRITTDGFNDLPNTSTNNAGGWIAETNDGLSILGSTNASSGGAGAILFEFSTTGKENIQVSAVRWTKLDQASRTMSIALQYRVGDTGTWIDVDSPSSSVYSTGTAGRANGSLDTQTLPSLVNNQAIVQIRWIYWESSTGSSGSRDRLGLDEVSITGTDIPTGPTLSINDVSNPEGNSGSTNAEFTVSLSLAAATDVTFTYATANSTAIEPGDYTTTTGTGTIIAGDLSTTILVPVIGDTDSESDETFEVNLTNPTVATIADGQGIGTITNDDAVPITLSINDVTISEGNSGTSTASFTVSLSAPAPAGGVTFDIATASGTAADGSDFVGKSLSGQSIAEGLDSYTFTAEINGDVASEPTETFFVNVTSVTGSIVSDGQGLGTITNDDLAPPTLISAIQGSGASAALLGTQTIEAIVVGDYQNEAGNTRLGGFFVQEEDADADANSATSEGIFVYEGAGLQLKDVAIGDKVSITGTVSEFFNLTEISVNSASNITIVSTGNSTPTAATLSFPSTPTQREAMEGMLVTIPATMTITNNFSAYIQPVVDNTRGEIEIASNGKQINFTEVNLPSVSGLANYTTDQESRKIILDDDRGNTTTFLAYHLAVNSTNKLRSGSTVEGLTGVLDYAFDAYRIRPLAPVAFTNANPRSGPPVLSGKIKVATVNLLNFFNGDGMGGGFPTARGATTQAALNLQKAKSVAALKLLNADVIGFEELEKDGYGPLSAIQELTNALNDATAPGTYQIINHGSLLGTDVITVGIIYKPAVVTPFGVSLSTSTLPATSRPPMAQTFTANNSCEKFTIVVNHFKSKGGTGTGANADINDGQGNWNALRVESATALNTWINTTVIPAAGNSDVLILGDLNAYKKEDPIKYLEDNNYTNLVAGTSYAFDGFFGSLDHLMSSASLTPQFVDGGKWQNNSDEVAQMFHYDGYVPESNEYATSDHNPTIASFTKNIDLANISTVTSTSTKYLDDYLLDADCKVIAKVEYGTAAGSINASVTIGTGNIVDGTATYGPRKYEITPATNGTATVTLYFTQAEFDIYSADDTKKDLPLNAADIEGNKANLLIFKKSGGGTIEIDPADANIIFINGRWEVTFDVTSFSEFFLGSAPDVALPVTLISFSGKKQNNTNLLEWKTANEKAFDGFEVQRSEDGKGFEKIGFVKGGTNENYQFSDNNLSSKTNFYRLKMIDLDGSSALSKIIAIQSENESNTLVGKVYPNPAIVNTAVIDITVEKAGIWKITTFNAQGSLQTSNEVQLSKGLNKVSIEFNNLSQGIYFLNLENSNGEKFVRKVLKN